MGVWKILSLTVQGVWNITPYFEILLIYISCKNYSQEINYENFEKFLITLEIQYPNNIDTAFKFFWDT